MHAYCLHKNQCFLFVCFFFGFFGWQKRVELPMIWRSFFWEKNGHMLPHYEKIILKFIKKKLPKYRRNRNFFYFPVSPVVKFGYVFLFCGWSPTHLPHKFEKKKKGITNTLALPIDKMLYIYLLCPQSEHQNNPFQTKQSKHFHQRNQFETNLKLIHLMWNWF
jgi:hypothetical protein